MLAFNNSPNPGQAASLCGCEVLTTAGVGSPTNSALSSGNYSSAFRWRAGNLADRAATGKWIRSIHSPIDRLRPVEVQNQVIVADNLDITNELTPPFMWSAGDLLFQACETEQFNWGWKPPVQSTGRDEIIYENMPQQLRSFYVPAIEDEQFSWGLAPSIATGTTLMGFRGFWSLRAGMGSEDVWSFDSGVVVAAINAFDDVDQAVAQQATGFTSEDLEKYNWGWLPPMAQVVLDEAHLDHRFRFDSATELEAITEDFIVEMVSVDELYTGQVNISPVYQDDDVFGFQTAVVTVQQAFDQDEGILNRQLAWQGTSEDETITEDFVHEMVSVDTMYVYLGQSLIHIAEDDQFGYQIGNVISDEPQQLSQALSVQSNDEDIAQVEFFATDRIPEDYDQLVITNQLSLYWNDDDASQSTFFAREQYSDNDEQFISPYLLRYQEDDVFGFNVPEVLGELVLDEETPLPNQPYPLWQQLEDEQFGENAPFLVTNAEPWEQYGQLPNPPYPVTHQLEFEQFGQQAPFLTSFPSDDSLDQLGQTYWVRDIDDSWGFNTPELLGELLLEEEVQLGNLPYPLWQQVEDEQFGKQAPFISSFPSDDSLDQLAQNWFARDQIEEFGFNTPELIGELLLEEEVQLLNQPYPITWSVEDEQFGKQSPFITSQPFDDTDHYPILRFITDDVDVFGFQTPQLIVQDIDDTPQLKLLSVMDDDQFSFQPVFVSDDMVTPTQQSIVVQSVDEDSSQATFFTLETYGEGVDQPIPQQLSFYIKELDTDFDSAQSTFFASEQYSDNDEQAIPYLRYVIDDVETFGFQPEISEDLAFADEDHFVGLQFITQTEDVSGLNAPFITSFPSDDFTDQLPNKPYPIVAEDDLVFPPSTTLANMLYDTDFNPTMQSGYYFGAEDLEKYNWGWLPPMTKVTEDDSPYDSRTQLQSYFIPAIEDEQFSWGFDGSRFYALGDEAPYFTPAQMRSFYVPEVEDEQAQWGFSQPTFGVFDQDEPQPSLLVAISYDFDEGRITNWVITADEAQPSQLITVTSDVDIFGQSPPFLTSFPSDDSSEQLPKIPLIWDDTEPIGQNAPFLTSIGFDDSIDQIVREARVSDDTEQFSFENPFVTVDEVINPTQKVTIQEDELFGERPPFLVSIGFDDSPEQIAGKPYLVDDIETFGFQQQFPLDTSFLDESIVLGKVVYGETEQDVFGFQTAFVMALDDNPEHLPNVIKVVDDIEAFGFQQQFPFELSFPDDNIVSGFQVKLDGIEEFGFNAQFVFDTTFPDENIITRWLVSFDDTEPVGQNPPFLETIGLEAEEANLLNPPYPVTYQLENDQIGQNPPFIVSMQFGWEEDGVPPNPPYPITDPTIHDGWIRFIRKIRAVFGSGASLLTKFTTSITKDSGTGSTADTEGAGKVDGTKGTK